MDFNIVDKIKLRAVKSAIPMIQNAIEDYLPKILEEKTKIKLEYPEKDVVVLLFESKGNVYFTLVTMSNENKIIRHLWTKPLSEVLQLITKS